MSSLPTPEPSINPTFVCESEEWCSEICVEEPYYGEYEGKRYCVLHFPSKEKAAAFAEALKRKLDAKEFDFRGVWFPDITPFNKFHFSGEVIFSRAFFSAYADFSEAIFDGDVYFTYAKFNSEVSFNSTIFRALAYFRHATFGAEADFELATFSGEADFSVTVFSANTKFGYTTIMDYIKFSGDGNNPTLGEQSWLDLQHARIDNPDHVFFHTLILRPHWFVNVDARKFNFINVEWVSITDWTWKTIDQELDALKIKDISPPHRLLAIAYRQLAVNAEENHRYEEASKFRYMAMDARRLESWRGFAPWRLSWWYWLASGYGERVFQAFVVLLGIWIIAALFYTQVGFARWEPKLASESDVATAKRDEVGKPLRPLSRALTYSLGVMTLQKPEPRPATTAAQTLVMMETILGAVQAALLALAIRRKFMR
ncbi:MAG: hypothetical protein AUG51_01055 [Acidobacteria bacterium 13_1_20CM_3_53_8]|nr:MAG: hypothetical protein AUG51_01055 [Acidobacteria bacterium 13_1_20CM_3_53_8]